jgi:hypothetical protein
MRGLRRGDAGAAQAPASSAGQEFLMLLGVEISPV